MSRITPAAAGTSLAVVSGQRALLVRIADDAGRIDPLWDAMSGDASIQSVIEVLTADGLSKTPQFILLELGADSSVNCIVRGEIALQLETDSGPRTVDASTVTTWVETSIPAVVSYRAGPDGLATLPLITGAAWASSISWSSDGAALPVVPVVPAEPVEPIAAAEAPVAAAPPLVPAIVVPPAIAPPVPTPTPAPEHAPEPVPEHTIAAATVTGDVIDQLHAAAEAASQAEMASGYDSLFDQTMMRSIEDAAVRPPTEDEQHEEAAAPAAPALGDHDGMTVMNGDIAKLRASRKNRKPGAAESTADVPVSYTLTLSTGGVETLEGIALVGRSPSVSKVSGETMPKLIAIPGDQDISRNHVQFAVEGGTVVVTDLHSRNGTTIVLPGKPPQLLRQGESTSVLVDTLVDLGGGVTILVGHQ